MSRFIFSALALALVSGAAIAADADVTTSPTGQKAAIGLPHPYSSAFTRATQARGVDAVDGQLAAHLPQLKQLAQQGDVTAAVLLFYSLAQCHALAADFPTSQNFADHCTGVSKDDMSQLGKWLETAAELGNEGAQYDYAMGGFDYVLGMKQAEKDSAALKAYVEKSRSYLDGLSKQCNFDAIASLSKEQRLGGLVYTKNVDQAYKFLVIKQTIARTPSNEDAAYAAQLEGEISPGSKIISLRKDASSFVTAYCR
jgi:hypothetical protein